MLMQRCCYGPNFAWSGLQWKEAAAEDERGYLPAGKQQAKR